MNLSEKFLSFLNQVEFELIDDFKRVTVTALQNQAKMLEAFQNEHIRSHHFNTSTGYGYNDLGREALEKVFARVFKAESALVRQQLVSGTHAIACALFGNLKHSDELIIATGLPYETLHGVLGITTDSNDSISETGGFRVKIIPLTRDDLIDTPRILSSITHNTKWLAFQRSCGYSQRHSFTISELAVTFEAVKQKFPEMKIFVDNCYGEFVEQREPIEVGADLVAGSLIKNPGGCLIPSGGYIIGRETLVEKAAERLYVPRIGGEIGPSLLNLQIFFQGFFESPHRVSEMVKGAMLAAKLFQVAGFNVSPLPSEPRTDIIQKIFFNSAQELIDFCQEVQKCSPVESDVHPEPAKLPGYIHRVVMGGGTFIAGATSEFTVDAPLIPPYVAYLQGGLSYTQIKLSLYRIFESLNLKSSYFKDLF